MLRGYLLPAEEALLTRSYQIEIGEASEAADAVVDFLDHPYLHSYTPFHVQQHIAANRHFGLTAPTGYSDTATTTAVALVIAGTDRLFTHLTGDDTYASLIDTIRHAGWDTDGAFSMRFDARECKASYTWAYGTIAEALDDLDLVYADIATGFELLDRHAGTTHTQVADGSPADVVIDLYDSNSSFVSQFTLAQTVANGSYSGTGHLVDTYVGPELRWNPGYHVQLDVPWLWLTGAHRNPVAVVLHELVHTFGVGHVDDWNSLMFPGALMFDPTQLIASDQAVIDLHTTAICGAR